MNEGFTVFLERKIVRALSGEKEMHLHVCHNHLSLPLLAPSLPPSLPPPLSLPPQTVLLIRTAWMLCVLSLCLCVCCVFVGDAGLEGVGGLGRPLWT